MVPQTMVSFDHLTRLKGRENFYYRLKVFENIVLRRIFKSKREEVTGELRKLHKVELHNLYFPPILLE